MSNYDNLLGLPYLQGKQDCYSIARRYYAQVWGLRLPNWARPTAFWNDENLNLYKQYRTSGFVPVTDDDWQIGDTLLMPLRTQFHTHAAVIVADNKILHHLPGQLSTIESLRPKWANRATAVIRHPDVTATRADPDLTVNLHEVTNAHVFRDPKFQNAVARVMGDGE
jgi:cell wall-associated NlpC family hydrolase